MNYNKDFNAYSQAEQASFDDWVYDTTSIIYNAIQNKKFTAPKGIDIYDSTDWDTVENTGLKTNTNVSFVCGNHGAFYVNDGVLTYLVYNPQDSCYYKLDDLIEDTPQTQQNRTPQPQQSLGTLKTTLLAIGVFIIYSILKK